MQGAPLIPIGLESFARDFQGLRAVVRVPTIYRFTDKIHIQTYPRVPTGDSRSTASFNFVNNDAAVHTVTHVVVH